MGLSSPQRGKPQAPTLTLPPILRSSYQILAIFGTRRGLIPQSQQDAITQFDRIAGAALSEFDHLLGHGVCARKVIIAETEGSANVRVSTHHRRNRFRLERLVFEQVIDGHGSDLTVLTYSN
ncbi:MAG TPA: hypothetical protein VGH13_17305 [Xanthobacteraceae bacterium]